MDCLNWTFQPKKVGIPQRFILNAIPCHQWIFFGLKIPFGSSWFGLQSFLVSMCNCSPNDLSFEQEYQHLLSFFERIQRSYQSTSKQTILAY